ncbi:hypothetical protein ABBQ32_013254 [Trebouxia sp. C0010 RCD-2024]
MTQISLLPTRLLCNHRLQSSPLLQRKTPYASPPSTHARDTGCSARLRVHSCFQQGQHAHVRHEGPDISGLDPALQKQWDHAANKQLGNIAIKPHSNRKVYWRCDQCPDGHLHSWSARVYQRTRGDGCPQCRGRQVCKHNSLATKAPLVAAEWDHVANAVTPDDVVSKSNVKFGWHCQLCHCKWRAAPSDRLSKAKTGCPQCARTTKKTRQPTFAECDHSLLAEWDHKRNTGQEHCPDKVRLKSAKKIFWLCTKCPAGQEHSWSARPFSRTGCRKSGCPFCTGKAACRCNSLQALYPDTAAEWDYGRNHSQPSDHPASSAYLAWWINPQRDSWQQTINARTSQVQKKTARLKRAQEQQTSAGGYATATAAVQ